MLLESILRQHNLQQIKGPELRSHRDQTLPLPGGRSSNPAVWTGCLSSSLHKDQLERQVLVVCRGQHSQGKQGKLFRQTSGPGFCDLFLRHSSNQVGSGPFPARAADSRADQPNLWHTVPRARFILDETGFYSPRKAYPAISCVYSTEQPFE